MSLPTDVPGFAEALAYGDFYGPVQVESTIVPGAKARKWRFKCPACQAEREPLAIRTNVSCAGCDLRFHTDGIDLYVWREPSRVRAA